MEPLSLDPMAGGVERSATANTSTSFTATSHHLALRASLLHHHCRIRRRGKVEGEEEEGGPQPSHCWTYAQVTYHHDADGRHSPARLLEPPPDMDSLYPVMNSNPHFCCCHLYCHQLRLLLPCGFPPPLVPSLHREQSRPDPEGESSPTVAFLAATWRLETCAGWLQEPSSPTPRTSLPTRLALTCAATLVFPMCCSPTTAAGKVSDIVDYLPVELELLSDIALLHLNSTRFCHPPLPPRARPQQQPPRPPLPHHCARLPLQQLQGRHPEPASPKCHTRSSDDEGEGARMHRRRTERRRRGGADGEECMREKGDGVGDGSG